MRTQVNPARKARMDAWMEVFKALPSSKMQFDVVETNGLIGAVYSTPDRKYTAVPAPDWGYIIVERGVGQIHWTEERIDLNRDVHSLRRMAAQREFDAQYPLID